MESVQRRGQGWSLCLVHLLWPRVTRGRASVKEPRGRLVELSRINKGELRRHCLRQTCAGLSREKEPGSV